LFALVASLAGAMTDTHQGTASRSTATSAAALFAEVHDHDVAALPAKAEGVERSPHRSAKAPLVLYAVLVALFALVVVRRHSALPAIAESSRMPWRSSRASRAPPAIQLLTV
jgi:hypothetical protein